MQDGVTENEVELAVLEGQLGGFAGSRLDLKLQLARGGLELAEHPRGDVGGDRRPDHPSRHPVEREVARAVADLERALVAARLAAERLAQLAPDLGLADRAVVDAPLGVVVLGGEVVVADVGVPDGLRGLHRPGEGST